MYFVSLGTIVTSFGQPTAALSPEEAVYGRKRGLVPCLMVASFFPPIIQETLLRSFEPE